MVGLEKKSRYSDLRKMTKKDLEDELNFYTFLDELIGASFCSLVRGVDYLRIAF